MAKNWGLISIVFVGILSRFIPHPPNMTAIGAMVIFSGAMVQPRLLGVLLPAIVVLATDCILGWHSALLFTTFAWLSLAFVSSFVLRRFSYAKLAGLSIFATFWFFLISNLGVWWADSLYAKTASGLLSCLMMALPFLGNQLLGDVLGSLAVFVFWFQVVERFAFLKETFKS